MRARSRSSLSANWGGFVLEVGEEVDDEGGEGVDDDASEET